MKILYLLITALKFMAILIMILLLLLLFLIIIVLVVPIKYRVDISKEETIDAYANIKWLYSIVSVDIIYNSDNEMKQILKLFGIKIDFKKSKVKTKKKPRKDKLIKSEIKNEKVEKQVEINKSTSQKSQENKKGKKGKKGKKDKNTKNGGIKESFKKIQSFDYKKELLTDTLGWVKKVFKRISPDFFYMYLEIGREDPADTGQLMAALSALYPFYHPSFNIVGNYEKECLYGKIKVSGDMTIGKLLYDFIKFIRTKSIKELIRVTRKNRKGKKNGRKIAK